MIFSTEKRNRIHRAAISEIIRYFFSFVLLLIDPVPHTFNSNNDIRSDLLANAVEIHRYRVVVHVVTRPFPYLIEQRAAGDDLVEI